MRKRHIRETILVMDNSSLAGTVGPNPGTGSTTAVARVIALLFMIMITNFNFTIYHLYMRQKPEFSNRLLNVLYSFHASLLQCGSFLILLIFCSKTMYRVSQKNALLTLEANIPGFKAPIGQSCSQLSFEHKNLSIPFQHH